MVLRAVDEDMIGLLGDAKECAFISDFVINHLDEIRLERHRIRIEKDEIIISPSDLPQKTVDRGAVAIPAKVGQDVIDGESEVGKNLLLEFYKLARTVVSEKRSNENPLA